MATKNYGRIAIMPRGDYSESTQYEVGDIVSYNGSSYLAKSRPPVATVPTNTNYWQMSAHGYQGGGTAQDIDYTDTYSIGETNVQGALDNTIDRVESAENDMASIGQDLEDLSKDLMLSNATFYVSPSGNDTTGDGTQANPFKTIQKAIDSAPEIQNKYHVTDVYLSAGTYNGNVSVIGQRYVAFRGASGTGNVVINGGISANRGAMVDITGINQLTINVTGGTDGVSASNGSQILLNCVTTISNGSKVGSGIFANIGSFVFVNYALTIDGLSFGIRGFRNSNIAFGVSSLSVTIQNCNYSIYSQEGAIVSFSTGYPVLTNNTNAPQAVNGGRIEFGTQGWQLIGSVTGTSSVTIDSNKYTEFLVLQREGGENYVLSYIIPSSYLSATNYPFSQGRYATSSSNSSGVINVSNTLIGQAHYYKNGTNVTSSSTMSVYGRR